MHKIITASIINNKRKEAQHFMSYVSGHELESVKAKLKPVILERMTQDTGNLSSLPLSTQSVSDFPVSLGRNSLLTVPFHLGFSGGHIGVY